MKWKNQSIQGGACPDSEKIFNRTVALHCPCSAIAWAIRQDGPMGSSHHVTRGGATVLLKIFSQLLKNFVQLDKMFCQLGFCGFLNSFSFPLYMMTIKLRKQNTYTLLIWTRYLSLNIFPFLAACYSKGRRKVPR